MRYALAILVLSTLAVLGFACADTYCQSGPRYGTSCYSGATVREHDPLAPVAPMPQAVARGGVSHWLGDDRPSRDAGTPDMLGLPRDAAADGHE